MEYILKSKPALIKMYFICIHTFSFTIFDDGLLCVVDVLVLVDVLVVVLVLGLVVVVVLLTPVV